MIVKHRCSVFNGKPCRVVKIPEAKTVVKKSIRMFTYGFIVVVDSPINIVVLKT